MTGYGRPVLRRRLAAAFIVAAALGSGPAGAGTPTGVTVSDHRFLALACIDVDPHCAERAPLSGLLVAATAPQAAELAALLRAAPSAAGAELPHSPLGASPGWLVALGPLQAAGTVPLLRSLALRGDVLSAEFDYQPYTSVGPSQRRFVPSYPVALLALPPLAKGALQITVRWSPLAAARPSSPAAISVLGPLRLVVH